MSRISCRHRFMSAQREIELQTPRASRAAEGRSAQRRCLSDPISGWVVSGSQSPKSKSEVPRETQGVDDPRGTAPMSGGPAGSCAAASVVPRRWRSRGTGSSPASRSAPSPRKETELAAPIAWGAAPKPQFPRISRARPASVESDGIKCVLAVNRRVQESGPAGTAPIGGWNRSDEEYSVRRTARASPATRGEAARTRNTALAEPPPRRPRLTTTPGTGAARTRSTAFVEPLPHRHD